MWAHSLLTVFTFPLLEASLKYTYNYCVLMSSFVPFIVAYKSISVQ